MSPDESKFIENLYNQYGALLWRYARASVNNNTLADELVSDVFHVASEKPAQLMEHPAPRAWLFKTMQNKLKQRKERCRRDARRLLMLDEHALTALPPPRGRPTEEQAEVDLGSMDETKEKITAVLSPQELYILRRITLDKAAHKTVAQELGISVWDSQKKLERIRKKLGKVFPERAKQKKKK